MAIIKISELRPAGSELFQDSESFLNELTEQETVGLEGGFAFNGTLGISISAQTVNGNTINANTAGNINTAVIA
ncbi:hypothetical protein BZZ01_24810 [Nostocales cyanobacterium HT-58-2]|nr:hypothetical protein BZZ01_24810 [Nostocales cyanobacterium HT-58-2]